MSAAAPRARGLPVEARIFLVFAFTYFFAALLRGVTATLAPAFSADLGLGAADLGLLAGAFFFGFAVLQLPLGGALDRHGPRRVLVALLAVAVLACALFALASSLAALVAARALIGVGVGASLMAALTSYRRHFSVPAQLRANSWMLMTGSLGMLASTLPVQVLLPLVGWRGLFWGVGAMLAVGAGLVAWLVPPDHALAPHTGPAASYGAIVRHPLFVRLAPLACFGYGGMIAVQSLWAGPWLTRVAGRSPAAAAQGLFAINLSMLVAFLSWGVLMPRLARRGIDVPRLITWGAPLALMLLAANVAAGADAGALHWAAWCVASSVMSLSQPAIGMAFPPAQAGRALSAFNLVIFGGVFCLQWGLGLAIDSLVRAGLAEPAAFQVAFGGFWLLCMLAYAAFLLAPRFHADNAR